MALEKGPFEHGGCLAGWFPAYKGLLAACTGLWLVQLTFSQVRIPFLEQ